MYVFKYIYIYTYTYGQFIVPHQPKTKGPKKGSVIARGAKTMRPKKHETMYSISPSAHVFASAHVFMLNQMLGNIAGAKTDGQYTGQPIGQDCAVVLSSVYWQISVVLSCGAGLLRLWLLLLGR